MSAYNASPCWVTERVISRIWLAGGNFNPATMAADLNMTEEELAEYMPDALSYYGRPVDVYRAEDLH